MNMRCPPTIPWCTKVVLGFGLIGHFALLAFQPQLLPTLFRLPYPLFLGLVLVGGAINLGHYLLLERALKTHREARLVTAGGLFTWLRHPMYLGDGLLYLGFAVYPATPISLAAYAIAACALLSQARREDAAMAAAFSAEHDAWRRRSWLLLPGL